VSESTTKELKPGTLVRSGWSSVWSVVATSPIGNSQHGERWSVTLKHGTTEVTVESLEYVRWLHAEECGPKCKQTGKHTGR